MIPEAVMRRILVLLLLLTLLPLPALAQEGAYVEPCQVEEGQAAEIRYYLPAFGKAALSLSSQSGTELMKIFSARSLVGGLHVMQLDAQALSSLAPGSYLLTLTYGDSTCSAPFILGQETAPAAETPIPAPTQAPAVQVYTPSLRSHYSHVRHENCYWCTPMDITDEAAVWAMLTAPITVVDADQKAQAVLYAQPDTSSEQVGVVTGASQSVHVLETYDNGWTLVETYSSSFHDSKVKNWNAFVSGYIQSSKLKTRTVNQEYGIVIDKLTQRLYLFHDGPLETALSVSTGLYNTRQPYNETRSGEFVLVSKVGDFKSDSLICAMGMRFNSGDLLHEVPHTVNADGSKNYKNCETKLGIRASHGCIRVQRGPNGDGYNMRWIYENVKLGTKLAIWEDYQGRQMPYPADGTALYYNPNGGNDYHCNANCIGVRSAYRPLTPFTYGELETGAYASLNRCIYCQPVLRKAEIDKINREHLSFSPGEIMALMGY